MLTAKDGAWTVLTRQASAILSFFQLHLASNKKGLKVDEKILRFAMCRKVYCIKEGGYLDGKVITFVY